MKQIFTNPLRAFMLAVSFLFAISLSAVKVEIDGINYDIIKKAKQATAVAKSSGYYSGAVVIPESVEYEGVSCAVTSIGDYAFDHCFGLTSVIIPNSVTSIGVGAFSDCSGLTSATIPNSVTSIGDYAFSGCSGLTSVTIPNSVKSIGSGAFEDCSGLTSVTIPNSVTSIGAYAFSGCSGLTSVTIGNSVTSIGASAFYDCFGLTEVHISDIAAWCKIVFEGTYVNAVEDIVVESNPLIYAKRLFLNKEEIKELFIPDNVTNIGGSAFRSCKGLTSVAIPNSVTSIGKEAFAGCSGLTSMTIPNSVTSIDGSAFASCKGLTSIIIGNSVTSIGDGAFFGCSGLTSVIIPNSVTRIDEEAFAYCSGLTSVTIGKSVTSIGEEAFSSCSGLTSIKVDEANQTYDSRNNCNAIIETETNELIVGCKSTFIPNSVTNIGYVAFLCCSGLTSVTIPNSVTSIGWSAFQGCSGLTSVTIPNSVTSIGDCAFAYCKGLTSVTIGNSVTRIGFYAFGGCSELTDVYCYAEKVPSTNSNAFDGSYVEYATLHVPTAAIEGYKATTPWSGFGEIVALPAEEVEITIGSTGATTFCSEYALDFTDAEDVKAYAATGYNTETGVVTLTRVKTAKAGTGLFVVGDEGTYSIPTIESSADNSLNMLVGTTEEVTIPTADGTYTNYIYGKSDDTTGFFKLTGDKVIPAGKAYLQIPTAWFPAVAESKIKIEFEDGTTTGIDDIEEQVRPNDGVIYDLHGRVVKNPGKGIYIVNGKKVLF